MKLMVRLLTLFSLLGMMSFAITLRGRVDDAKCAPHHMKAGFSPACARMCVKKGIAAVLYSRGRIYHVANPNKLAPFAGEHVTVVGFFRHHRLVVRRVSKR